MPLQGGPEGVYELWLAGGPDAKEMWGGPANALQGGPEGVYELWLAGGPDAKEIRR